MKNPFLFPGHYPIGCEAMDDIEYEQHLKELAELKKAHPERFLPPEQYKKWLADHSEKA
jgi:hypothetical protein